jgi:hypothetical protein
MDCFRGETRLWLWMEYEDFTMDASLKSWIDIGQSLPCDKLLNWLVAGCDSKDAQVSFYSLVQLANLAKDTKNLVDFLQVSATITCKDVALVEMFANHLSNKSNIYPSVYGLMCLSLSKCELFNNDLLSNLLRLLSLPSDDVYQLDEMPIA